MTPRRLEMLALVRQAHQRQTRNNGRVPYWMHVQSVAQILEWVIERDDEIGDSMLREDLFLAALGHDLYEDTEVTSSSIRERFGERVDGWIRALTNDGDQDRAAYLDRILAAPEEVKLIKLADLLDNTASVAYGIHDLGVKWTGGTFLVIASEMGAVMRAARFERYPRTADALMSLFAFHHQRLIHAFEMHQEHAAAAARAKGGGPEVGPRTKPARHEISPEIWKRALERTRERERKEGERVFKGGKPFFIPDKDDD